MKKNYEMPDFLQEPLLDKAELKNMTKEQFAEYEDSLLRRWDLKGIWEGAFDKGFEQGIEIGREKGREIVDKRIEVILERMEKMNQETMELAERINQDAQEFAKKKQLGAIYKLLKNGISASDLAIAFDIDISFVLEIQGSI